MPSDVGDVLRIAVRQIGEDGEDIVNVYEAECTVAETDPDADILTTIAAYMDAAYAYLNSNLPAAQAPVDIKVDLIQLVGGVKQIVRNLGTISWGSSFNPSGSSDPSPSGVAAVVLLRTLVGKVFGRKFIGQLMEGNLIGNAYTGTLASAIASYAAEFLLAMAGPNTGTYVWGVLSTRTNQFERFVEAALSAFPGYQRRRRPGTGS